MLENSAVSEPPPVAIPVPPGSTQSVEWPRAPGESDYDYITRLEAQWRSLEHQLYSCSDPVLNASEHVRESRRRCQLLDAHIRKCKRACNSSAIRMNGGPLGLPYPETYALDHSTRRRHSSRDTSSFICCII
ncbi:hypothetical protein Ciccas_004309 [Cichlidogyrus casuarinus]|uniref:Uncharacterized protein n=1 Tax=Cichlidogyrus casuarinus TaxID=1844966 RepID=A0ABD2QBU1_9PLAT